MVSVEDRPVNRGDGSQKREVTTVDDNPATVIPWDRVMLSGISHVCVVVGDVEKAASAYSSLGIGPFTIREVSVPESRGMIRGKPARFSLRFGYARAGTITLELAQPLEGPSLHREFLESGGQGLHHIGFSAPAPLDEELARWEAMGISPLQITRRDDPRYGWAYLDTQSSAGCLLEVVCDPSIGWWDTVSLARDLARLRPEGGF